MFDSSAFLSYFPRRLRLRVARVLVGPLLFSVSINKTLTCISRKWGVGILRLEKGSYTALNTVCYGTGRKGRGGSLNALVP